MIAEVPKLDPIAVIGVFNELFVLNGIACRRHGKADVPGRIAVDLVHGPAEFAAESEDEVIAVTPKDMH